MDTCRERIYSFLSITWGIIADVDIESEKYRSLGNARFTVGAVSRILGKLLFNFLPPFYLIGPITSYTIHSLLAVKKIIFHESFLNFPLTRVKSAERKLV